MFFCNCVIQYLKVEQQTGCSDTLLILLSYHFECKRSTLSRYVWVKDLNTLFHRRSLLWLNTEMCRDAFSVSSLCSVLQTPAEGSRVSDTEQQDQQVCDLNCWISYILSLRLDTEKEICFVQTVIIVYLIPEIASVWRRTGTSVFGMSPEHADMSHVTVGCSVNQTLTLWLLGFRLGLHVVLMLAHWL